MNEQMELPVTDAVGSARREEVLAAATRLFNRHSFAAVTLKKIAHEVGLTPGGLYNHFDSKEALVFECFKRGLLIYGHELQSAQEAGLDGLEKVRRFIRGRLKPGEPRMIIFSDLDALPLSHRKIIHDGRAKNVRILASLVHEGMRDGSIAACEPLLTSLAIFSVLDWMPFWYSESRDYSRQEAAEALDDILTHGVTRRDAPEFVPPAHRDFTPLFTRLTPSNRRAAKRDRLLRLATRSFNARGVVGSSLEHIAADAGVSRGAYYYHAPDKNTLLYLCLERAYRTEATLLEELLGYPADFEEPLRHTVAFEFHLLRGVAALHTSPCGPKINFHNVPYLTAEQRGRLQQQDRSLVEDNRRRYDVAIGAGTFRNLDSLFIQEIGAGLRNYMHSWPQLTANYDAGSVADGFTRLFLFGLKPRSAIRKLDEAA
ncbi:MULTISPECIES: TetR/AcrR family transcriptional regulator [Hyphomonas]|uniref:TetR/AcrR family transcriptional regulator n=1 Tax=Hyphomonas TaxID=85 RepID=UPI003002E662